MRHLENILAIILLLAGLGCFGVFIEKLGGNSCKGPCCKKDNNV